MVKRLDSNGVLVGCLQDLYSLGWLDRNMNTQAPQGTLPRERSKVPCFLGFIKSAS